MPGDVSDPDALARAWDAVRAVLDPEIPVLSIVDLGIVRSLQIDPAGTVRVGISPTYSGCPATAVIRAAVEAALRDAGFWAAQASDVLSPPWSSDWITPHGREQLRAYGIAPPASRLDRPIACPRCSTLETQQVSEFGSTPCKALWRCTACLEPFEYFKCL